MNGALLTRVMALLLGWAAWPPGLITWLLGWAASPPGIAGTLASAAAAILLAG